MDDNSTKKRISIRVLASIIGVGLILTSIVLICDYRNRINQDTQRENSVSKIKQIAIPNNACYIGSKDVTPTYTDQSLLSGLSFDLLHTDIQLYAWNTEYQLNSGKKCSDIELIMVLNENLVYGKIQKSGNSKMQMDIIYASCPIFS